jgi:hypothetical protein
MGKYYKGVRQLVNERGVDAISTAYQLPREGQQIGGKLSGNAVCFFLANLLWVCSLTVPEALLDVGPLLLDRGQLIIPEVFEG